MGTRCVRHLPLVAVLMLSPACAQSPGAPSVPPPLPSGSAAVAAFQGVWQIEYQIAGCTGFRHCIDFIGNKHTIALRLVGSGQAYDGVLTVDRVNVDVSGIATSDGELTLTGTRPAAMATDFTIDVTELRVRLNTVGAPGAFNYAVRGPSNSSFYGSATKSGLITSVARSAEIQSWDSVRFDGTWRGNMAVEDCDSQGWAECYPHEKNQLTDVELTLTQAGSVVTGYLKLGPTFIEVTGTTSGSSVQLTGSTTTPGSGNTKVARLTAWTATRDAVGRLSGSFAFDLEWLWANPPGKTSRSTFRAVTLLSVALSS